MTPRSGLTSEKSRPQATATWSSRATRSLVGSKCTQPASSHQTATQATQRLQSVETAVTNIDQYQTVTDAEIRGYLDLARREGTPRPESQAVRAHNPAVIRAYLGTDDEAADA
mgnify:CR=1 FL=1